MSLPLMFFGALPMKWMSARMGTWGREGEARRFPCKAPHNFKHNFLLQA
ncbi:MAG: hypothetical protein KGM96_10290 [Acidobacteriota bacterium]|nr:hypothetical protein [Acidobacteriota bacterium]